MRVSFFAALGCITLVALGFLAGRLVVIDYRAAAGAAVIALLLSLAGARFGQVRPLTKSSVRWIPVAWLALFFVSNVILTQGRTPLDAASGSGSIDTAIELGAYLLVALVVGISWNRLDLGPRSRAGVGLLLAWPLLAFASTAWSFIPAFTAIRALQLFVPLALAAFMVRVWKSDPILGHLLVARTLRWLVGVTSILAVMGGVLNGALSGAGRLGLPYMHPDESAIVLGASLLALAFGRRQLTGFSLPLHVLQLIVLSGALYLTSTRTALLAFAAGALTALWLYGRRYRLIRYFGVLYYAGVGALAWFFARDYIVGVALRGQGVERLSNLNGRIPLWSVAVEQIREADRLPFGFGYGSPRVLLFSQVDWAGTAHSAWIELLLGIGLVGCVLAAIAVLRIGMILWRGSPSIPVVTTATAGGMFMFLLVVSLANAGFALPGFDFALLSLLAACALAGRKVAMAFTPAEQSGEVLSQGLSSAATRRAHRWPAHA